MKIAIISDSQYGAKQNYVPFLELNKKFFNNIFWPKLKEQGIKVIVHLGDLVERRKDISYLTARYLRDDFLEPAATEGYFLHWLIGNHDFYFRETMELNAVDLVNCGGRIWAYSKAEEIVLDGIDILFVPWMCKENQKQCLSRIESTKAKICFGHFELMGFETMKGNVKKEGMDPQLLSKFDMVLTGHYHHRSIKNNIYYVGSHAEFTWADYGDEHGFHIFDMTTKELEFVKNPYKVFAKVWYDDAYGVVSPPKEGFENLTGKIVKVIVSSKKDQAKYEWFMTEVENSQPLDIQIVDDHLNKDLIDDKVIASETEVDTLDIIRSHIKQANNVVPADKVDSLVVDLYKQAQEME